jgi:hypothetical protein
MGMRGPLGMGCWLSENLRFLSFAERVKRIEDLEAKGFSNGKDDFYGYGYSTLVLGDTLN